MQRSLTVLSPEPDATILPSGEKAIERTESEWPLSFGSSDEFVAFSYAYGTFNTRISLIPELSHNIALAWTEYKCGTLRLERSLFYHGSRSSIAEASSYGPHGSSIEGYHECGEMYRRLENPIIPNRKLEFRCRGEVRTSEDEGVGGEELDGNAEKSNGTLKSSTEKRKRSDRKKIR